MDRPGIEPRTPYESGAQPPALRGPAKEFPPPGAVLSVKSGPLPGNVSVPLEAKQAVTKLVSHEKMAVHPYLNTRGYQKVLSLTWKEPEIWIYSALFFNVVPFQLHTLVPSSYPVINTRSVEVNILVP